MRLHFDTGQLPPAWQESSQSAQLSNYSDIAVGTAVSGKCSAREISTRETFVASADDLSFDEPSWPARPARHRNGTGGLHLFPDPAPDLVGFGDDGGFVHRQDPAVAHDELTVDHARLDI